MPSTKTSGRNGTDLRSDRRRAGERAPGHRARNPVAKRSAWDARKSLVRKTGRAARPEDLIVIRNDGFGEMVTGGKARRFHDQVSAALRIIADLPRDVRDGWFRFEREEELEVGACLYSFVRGGIWCNLTNADAPLRLMAAAADLVVRDLLDADVDAWPRLPEFELGDGQVDADEDGVAVALRFLAGLPPKARSHFIMGEYEDRDLDDSLRSCFWQSIIHMGNDGVGVDTLTAAAALVARGTPIPAKDEAEETNAGEAAKTAKSITA